MDENWHCIFHVCDSPHTYSVCVCLFQNWSLNWHPFNNVRVLRAPYFTLYVVICSVKSLAARKWGKLLNATLKFSVFCVGIENRNNLIVMFCVQCNGFKRKRTSSVLKKTEIWMKFKTSLVASFNLLLHSCNKRKSHSLFNRLLWLVDFTHFVFAIHFALVFRLSLSFCSISYHLAFALDLDGVRCSVFGKSHVDLIRCNKCQENPTWITSKKKTKREKESETKEKHTHDFCIISTVK